MEGIIIYLFFGTLGNSQLVGAAVVAVFVSFITRTKYCITLSAAASLQRPID
jgi:hypothetical protein